MNLYYILNSILQYIAHGDRKRESKILLKEYDRLMSSLPANERRKAFSVVELGCGEGNMAKYFSPQLYKGIDLSKESITIARRKHPGYKFYIGDFLNNGSKDFYYRVDFLYCGAVLHHLNDSECRKLLNIIHKHAKKHAIFFVMEPVRPGKFWHNPFSFIMANLDKGRFVRTINEWNKLFGKYIQKVKYIKAPFYWPIDEVIYTLHFHEK